MTEELEQKAEEYISDLVLTKYTESDTIPNIRQRFYSYNDMIKAYKDGYEQGQKENEELKELKERLRIESQSLHEQCEIVGKQVEQIEKMKCCHNCKHHSFWGDELKCNFLPYEEELKCMKDKNKWELVE